MGYSDTNDSRSSLPTHLTYESIRFRTHTDRAFLMSDRDFKKKYGYRHGIQTPIGDISENLWYELMRELIDQNGDANLFEQLLEWYMDIPVAGRSKAGKERYVLRCFSHRIFDNVAWIDYIPFNQKYRLPFSMPDINFPK